MSARKRWTKTASDNGMNFAGMVDNDDPAKPRLISIFPTPVPPKDAPYKDFCDKGGRFGPHNTNQEIHNPAIAEARQPDVRRLVQCRRCASSTSAIRGCRRRSAISCRRSGRTCPAQTGAHASPIDWSEEIAVDARGNIYHQRRQMGHSSSCAIPEKRRQRSDATG